MAIKKRKIKSKRKAPPQSPRDRMGALLAEGHGTEAEAAVYFTAFHTSMLSRLQSIVTKAEELGSWSFMDGCFKQAMELYALAATLYERYPEHVMMTDGAFDALAKWLNKNYDNLDEEFRTWYAITAIDLEAATGMGVSAQPPVTVMIDIVLEQSTPSDRKHNVKTKVLQKTVKPRRRGRSKPTGTRSKGSDGKSRIRKRSTRT